MMKFHASKIVETNIYIYHTSQKWKLSFLGGKPGHEVEEGVPGGEQHHHTLAAARHLGPFLLLPLLPDRRQEMPDPRPAAHTDRVAM